MFPFSGLYLGIVSFKKVLNGYQNIQILIRSKGVKLTFMSTLIVLYFNLITSGLVLKMRVRCACSETSHVTSIHISSHVIGGNVILSCTRLLYCRSCQILLHEDSNLGSIPVNISYIILYYRDISLLPVLDRLQCHN